MKITKQKGYYMKAKKSKIEKDLSAMKKQIQKTFGKSIKFVDEKTGKVTTEIKAPKNAPEWAGGPKKPKKEKAVSAEKSNLLFEFPSLHGEKGKFVHLVVGSDLVDAAMRLAKARYIEKFLGPAKEHDPEGYEENKESFGPDGVIGYKRVALSAGDYIVRALVDKLQGTPTDQEPGVIEINHENKLAS